MSKKEFLKSDIAKKYVTWINVAGGICIALSAIQIPFLLTGANVDLVSLVGMIILLATGIALIVTKNVIPAWVMLIYSIFNIIAVYAATGFFGGYLYTIVGIAAVKSAIELKKLWGEIESKQPADASFRGADPLYTPAPSIDPAVIAAYKPTGTLTTVLASPDDPLPYQSTGVASAADQTPLHVAAPAMYQQDLTPAPAVAPAMQTQISSVPESGCEQVTESESVQKITVNDEAHYEEADTVIVPELHEEADTVMIPEIHEEITETELALAPAKELVPESLPEIINDEKPHYEKVDTV